MIGISPTFVEARKLMERIASCDLPVLIAGETGTGKELAARAVHYGGERAAMPFIPVNCGAIPDTLIESEFFGHQRGAFTDAKENKPGLIAVANGGTVVRNNLRHVCIGIQRLQPPAASGMMSACCNWRERSSE